MPDGRADLAIQVVDVEKRYRARKGETVAVESASLDVPRGSFVSLVGPSGCGKSTLLKVMLGLVRPTNGHVFVGDREVTAPTPDVGMMFQTSALLPWRSVMENVLLPIDLLRRRRSAYRQRAEELLELVGLSDFRDAYPNELSGGMQQRVTICRALVNDPPIILLDEPFGALDHITREQLNDELLRIWEHTHKTVVLVTHAIDEAVYLSDKVIVMTARPGRVAAEMEIRLPRPRSYETRTDPEFERCAISIRRTLGVGSSAPLADAPAASADS